MPLLRSPQARLDVMVRKAAWRLAAAALLVGLTQPGLAPAQAAPPLRAPAADDCSTVVTATGDAGSGTLRYAVACAQPGDTVTFAPGLAGASITLTSGEIAINQTLTIDGSAAPGVRVDGNHNSRIFYIEATGSVTLTALVLQHAANSEYTDGGAVWVGYESPLVLNQVKVLSNTALYYGAGVFAHSAVTVTNSLFQGNTCTDPICRGGGLYVNNRLAVTGTDFISNTAGADGGGVTVQFVATLAGSRFQGNTCTRANCVGGALYANDPLVITDTDFISNTATYHGGGIFTLWPLTLNGGRFQGNTCTTTNCEGGGLYSRSVLTLTNGLFQGNTSLGSGGGLAVTGTASLTLTNFTLSGNTAPVGGGLYVGGPAGARLLNVTVAGNSAANGGGLYADATASVGVTNTLLANNGAAACSGQIDTGSHNLEWPGTTCAAAGPSAGFTSANPLLGPLALNAPGATATHRLLPGSPARDAGHAATCAGPQVNNRDQRGQARPFDGDLVPGAICDIGAFEATEPIWHLLVPLVSR